MCARALRPSDRSSSPCAGAQPRGTTSGRKGTSRRRSRLSFWALSRHWCRTACSRPADSVIVRAARLRACVRACALQCPRLSAQRTERVPHGTLRLAWLAHESTAAALPPLPHEPRRHGRAAAIAPQRVGPQRHGHCGGCGKMGGAEARAIAHHDCTMVHHAATVTPRCNNVHDVATWYTTRRRAARGRSRGACRWLAAHRGGACGRLHAPPCPCPTVTALGLRAAAGPRRSSGRRRGCNGANKRTGMGGDPPWPTGLRGDRLLGTGCSRARRSRRSCCT
jgi:hypothetical protein